MTLLVQIGLWLVRKCGVGLLVAGAILVVGALYLYLSENLRSEAEREGRLAEVRERERRIDDLIAEVETRLQALEAETERQRNRAEVARRLLESFERMNTFWDWLFGAGVDAGKLAENKAAASQQRDSALESVGRLGEDLAAAALGKRDLESQRAQLRAEGERLERHASPVVQYLRRAWTTYRWPLALALALYFFGPTLWKLAAFYGLAPLVGRAASIRLADAVREPVSVTPSRVSEAVLLAEGETVFVRERFLQASDEALRRRTRFVLDWRIPFTCAACGLIELVELANAGGDGRSVTVSTQDDAAVELSIVALPEGASLVLRPRFLAGVVLPRGVRPRIRRHWRLFHLQAWVTLQFRYFEFQGPCRLIVAGSRGVRAEVLREGAALGRGGRRTNQDSTIGFTPELAYRSVRAETFWAYYRDHNPLFDDLFQGSGTFVCQEIATDGPGGGERRFWASVWNGLLKVFGL